MKQYLLKLRRWLRASILGATKTLELPGAEVDELLGEYFSGRCNEGTI